tara:strand:+ start:372 stop:683 length:312 start_codon:yes stop_codon:yes gene_type:complete
MDKVPTIIINTEEEEENLLTNNRHHIHSEIVKNIDHAYENDIENLTLFKIINNLRDYTMVLMVDKENWDESLEKCVKYFVSIEDYEMCDTVEKLRKKIKNGNI